MRELIFKAWNEQEKRFSKPFGLKDTILSFTDDDGLGVMKSLSDEIVVQFTGLTDKNGVSIYEGDLLQNESGRICVVKWHKFCAMFDCGPVVFSMDDNNDGFENNCWSRRVIKIGDIYSNPELLEDES